MTYIEAFAVEQWMDEYEESCRFNLAETCVRSLTVDELVDLTGDRAAFWEQLGTMQLTYGPIIGSPRLRELVAELYDHAGADDVMITHGAIGANSLAYSALVERGDHVVTVVPTYQQHYSIPESLGAEVDLVHLRADDDWLPRLEDIAAAVRPNTKLIALNNPNNPTGALIPRQQMEAIVDIAREVGAWVLCDEVYRGVDQNGDGFTASIADLYEFGISTGSMSKPYALAGLRLGWIVGPQDFLAAVAIHRDYTTISVGRIDDALAIVALENRTTILARSRAITRENLAVLDDWVASRADVSWVKPQSGTTALLGYDADIDSYDFCRRLLAEHGVMFTPGDAFGIPKTLRIGFADDHEVLKTGLTLTGEFLDSVSEW
ncbi:MAG: aminotransferase [Brevibacterium sp.]|uniref:aminotransferase n=1 Tax=Brevibacterium sandarakinum TaxID=629680 RepID=UPI002653734C|nr:aminotransferase [Brevibacterium sandarakinum]MDN5585044.1 aminotransferase [Brevibacterium sp.]MDN5656737.1 aminotransferase [Brevibacterium sandarakinum]